jgi:hypothetical protein
MKAGPTPNATRRRAKSAIRPRRLAPNARRANQCPRAMNRRAGTILRGRSVTIRLRDRNVTIRRRAAANLPGNHRPRGNRCPHAAPIGHRLLRANQRLPVNRRRLHSAKCLRARRSVPLHRRPRAKALRPVKAPHQDRNDRKEAGLRGRQSRNPEDQNQTDRSQWPIRLTLCCRKAEPTDSLRFLRGHGLVPWRFTFGATVTRHFSEATGLSRGDSRSELL